MGSNTSQNGLFVCNRLHTCLCCVSGEASVDTNGPGAQAIVKRRPTCGINASFKRDGRTCVRMNREWASSPIMALIIQRRLKRQRLSSAKPVFVSVDSQTLSQGLTT